MLWSNIKVDLFLINQNKQKYFTLSSLDSIIIFFKMNKWRKIKNEFEINN